MIDHRVLKGPIVTLGLAASSVAGHGIARGWFDAPAFSISYFVVVIVVGAWHVAWLLPASSRSDSLMVGTMWVVSVWLCQRGLQALGLGGGALLWAALLEGSLLWLLLQASPAASWADRLGRWRLARADITAQLALWPGLIPWFRSSMLRVLYGKPEAPSAPAFDRFMAELHDAEARTSGRIASAAMPEQLRQALLTSAKAIASQGELAAVELGLMLEQKAVCEATAFRDQCERHSVLSADQQRELARRGEALLLDLVGRSIEAWRPGGSLGRDCTERRRSHPRESPAA